MWIVYNKLDCSESLYRVEKCVDELQQVFIQIYRIQKGGMDYRESIYKTQSTKACG